MLQLPCSSELHTRVASHRRACTRQSLHRRYQQKQNDHSQVLQPLVPCRAATQAEANVSSTNAPGNSAGSTQSRVSELKHVPYGMDLASYPSMWGKTVLITGGAKGIGFNTARLLAGLGATVYLADIDTAGLARAVEDIQKELPGSQVYAAPQLDLGKQESVRAFVDWFAAHTQSASTTPSQPVALDVLINNAGANFMGLEPWFTDQGVAGLPQVNFLGPYTLTRLLAPHLLAAPAPRIVSVASVMHRFAEVPLDPQFFLRDWWTGGSYRNCKVALVQLTALLHQKYGPAGLTAVSVDPGAVYSNIWATSFWLGRPPGSTIIKSLFSPVEDACATSVHAAAAADVRGNQYFARGLFATAAIVQGAIQALSGLLSCVDWPLRNVSGGKWMSQIKAVEISRQGQDLDRGQALWDACADLAGLPREVQL